jgi:hypothetical protein
MSPDEIYEVLKQQPFRPVRLHMSNGRTHDLKHPDDVIVTAESLAVGVYSEGQRWPTLRMLSLININEIEPLATATR